MPPTPNLPKKPPCGFPDFPEGATEIGLPSETALKAYWDTDIYDTNGVNPGNIISIADDFEVCFRIELWGGLWRCICGTWCFDLCFDPCGSGAGFNLSEYWADAERENIFHVKDWKGCDTLCIERCVTVPAGRIPAERCSTLYEIGATFQLFCCDKPAPVVGYDALGHYQFYAPEP